MALQEEERIEDTREQELSTADHVKLALLGWLAMIGFDFFLHGGLLESVYSQPSPFLVSAERAFLLIPVGYVSFLLMAALLTWLMARLRMTGWRQGGRFGLIVGGLTWGALILGLVSISTIPLTLALAWFLGQTVELGLGGAVIGHGAETRNLRRLLAGVIIFALAAFAATVVLQNV
ncbi:MAG: hypothetical protein R3335_03705 [Anaerolineales bacterium]|nr:hypothetical protein [Anaerolineales bacterium]